MGRSFGDVDGKGPVVALTPTRGQVIGSLAAPCAARTGAPKLPPSALGPNGRVRSPRLVPLTAGQSRNHDSRDQVLHGRERRLRRPPV
ncbi:hypothetical protein DFR50_13728 [Roseiarcus fermentans]|uniref:Uncharacterized protein n=1 Tax=Roseiarcus fermentans TaxID=1473586 RepID=A0A366ERK1_9HYPH|nr:hypothetical protein DFR50_13728 [Roseiarcus fermentans]